MMNQDKDSKMKALSGLLKSPSPGVTITVGMGSADVEDHPGIEDEYGLESNDEENDSERKDVPLLKRLYGGK